MIGSNGLLEWVAAGAAPHAIFWNCAVDIFFGLTVKMFGPWPFVFRQGRKVERGLGGVGGEGEYGRGVGSTMNNPCSG